MLEEKLALANQKAQFFEAVVDVLKKDYGVSVVKKRSGKMAHAYGTVGRDQQPDQGDQADGVRLPGQRILFHEDQE